MTTPTHTYRDLALTAEDRDALMKQGALAMPPRITLTEREAKIEAEHATRMVSQKRWKAKYGKINEG